MVMPRSINELTDAEMSLIEKLESVTGLMDEKTEQLRDNGVFYGFAQIYREYAESEEPEAFKRAVFFFWFQFSEPSCFSGLHELPKETNDLVFEKLERFAADGNIDSELRWMLPYYYSISDWIFDDVYTSSKTLRRVLTEKEDHLIANVRHEDFVNRGLMGSYWGSANTRTVKR